MNSPFPGMDPYLEGPAFWPDFHFRFVNTWCEAVAGGLPEAYTARIRKRVYLVGAGTPLGYPDVQATGVPDMTSPFPGMDPYLEGPAFWPDFHSTFVQAWRESVAGALPEAYTARVGERVYLVEQPPVTKKRIVPDVAVIDAGRRGGGTALLSPPRTTLEPVTIPLGQIEEGREAYIEILHRPDHSLVAVLELLSPANKENPGRIEYLSKRNAILRQQVHLVELDLLRDGLTPPLEMPLPQGDYHYLLSRWDLRPNCQVYSWSMRDALPTLPVPLKDPDPDLAVPLQEVFAETFRRGRYARDLDYAAPPPGSLRETDRTWIAEVLKKAPTDPGKSG